MRLGIPRREPRDLMVKIPYLLIQVNCTGHPNIRLELILVDGRVVVSHSLVEEVQTKIRDSLKCLTLGEILALVFQVQTYPGLTLEVWEGTWI